MKKITQCRSCGSSALTPAFSIDAGNGWRKRRNKRAPLAFVVCDQSEDVHACGLLQSAYVGDPEIERIAPDGVFRANRSHLRAVATEALELISGRDCAALDIGCSDGTLMSFYPRWVERHGVDVAAEVDQVGAWAWTARAPFLSAEVDRALGDKKFDIVTAISVLENVDEPRAFLARIKSRLAPDGVIVIETRYAPMTLTRTSVETVFDGVGSIYSLGVLERLMRDCDLKIFRGALTDKEGGSVRLFATHAGVDAYDFDPWYERLARLWDEENALALHMQAPYQAFETRAAQARQSFGDMMARIKKDGRAAHLVTTTRAAEALLAWAGDARDAIEAVVTFGQVEDNAKQTIGAGGPPVISETASRAAEPDVIIAPHALKRELMERMREQIQRGAELLILSPAPHMVNAANYSMEFGKALAGGDGAGSVETLRAILGAAGGPRLVSDTTKRASA